ncbi:MAG: VWA domain-containing protein [Gammaproteobacteria bacterium]|jgi:Ca-activated chloride channel family protein|nr:VWA domain-containing protein [Gammaproteobacteria bacterium]MDP6731753.1 VWA domain-containing protein [Gammaproteobacteria bacterium]
MEFLIPANLLQDFHFLRPLWLLALIPTLLFFGAMWRINTVVTAWDKAIDKSLLPYLLDRSKNAAQRTPLLLLFSAWLLSIIAMAGPVWQQLPQPVQKREDAMVIVMDLSLSMFAPDHAPNRLDLAKRKLRDILALREEGQTALVVYAGDAHTVTPLTDDVVTIDALVPSLSPNIMPLFGSNPMAAIDMAIGLLDDIEATRGKILFMTDGISGFDQELLITEQFEGTGYELLIMGIGTEAGAPIRTSDGSFLTDENGAQVIPKLNKNVLQSLANRSGGRYHDIQLSDADLAFLLTENELLDDTQLSEVEEEFDIWYETGPFLLLLVLPLCALSFRRGWLFSIVLLGGSGLLFPSQHAQAQGFAWRDLWQTRDQQAAEAFANEDHGLAAALFKVPEWRGTSSYRAQDYESAIAAFSASDTPDGHYNRGNSLALAGNYEEAIAAYDIAIGREPDHADAIFNKEIVEELLEQQQAEEGENQEGDSKENQSEQNSQNQSEEQNEQSEQDQESEEGNEDQQEQEQQSQPPEDQEGSESNSEQNTPSEATNEEFEEQQSLEQWLRRIDDDPGELLRRKFRYQYRQRQLNGTANSIQNGGQIW